MDMAQTLFQLIFMFTNNFFINWYSGLFLLPQIRKGDSSGFDNKRMKRNIKIVQFFLLNSILDGALQLSHEFVIKFM